MKTTKYLSLVLVGLLLGGSVYGNSRLSEVLKGKLVVPDQRGFKAFESDPTFADKKYIALYFGAHWCPPCNIFVPKLLSLYKEMGGGKPGSEFEVVFVSADRSEREMLRYMLTKKMPWPALKYEDIPSTPEVTKFSGPGIPTFVVIDEQGNIVVDTFDRSNPAHIKYENIDEALYALKKLLQKGK